MLLSQIITEANVNQAVFSSAKIIANEITTLVNSIYDELDAKAIVYDADAKDSFLDDFKKKLQSEKENLLLNISKALSKLTLQEIEHKFGKITNYRDQSPAKWETLWWVNAPIVWVQQAEKKSSGVYGYFQRSAEAVKKDFPKELTSHLNFNDDVPVGIALFVPTNELLFNINEEVYKNIVESDHVGFMIADDLKKIVDEIAATFSHELKHLFHYIAQNLDTANKNIRNSLDLFNMSNFLPKKKRIYPADDNQSFFDGIDLPTYLMTATEVDAHATSVAAKILLKAQNDNNPKYEIEYLEGALQDLSYNYDPTNSASFKYYQDNIKDHGKQFNRVWKRFLKKIASEINDRISELKNKI